MDAWVNVPVPANGTSSGKKRKVQGASLEDICTVSRAWAPDTVRLEFAVAPALQPVLEVLLKILVGSGGDLKAGPPPRSKYERAIANLLAELGEGPAAAAEQ